MLLLQELARNHPKFMLGAGILSSPYADLTHSGESGIYNLNEDGMVGKYYKIVWDRKLITGGIDLADPRVSAVFGSFEGLPPLYFIVGSTEVLYSDTMRAAHKAKS